MQLLLAAISDLTTGAVAVVALLLGVVLIARGPRSESPTGRDDALGITPLPVPVSAPAEAAAEPAPQPTTFRHGTIKLGHSAPPIAEPVTRAPQESAPFAQAQPGPLAAEPERRRRRPGRRRRPRRRSRPQRRRRPRRRSRPRRTTRPRWPHRARLSRSPPRPRRPARIPLSPRVRNRRARPSCHAGSAALWACRRGAGAGLRAHRGHCGRACSPSSVQARLDPVSEVGLAHRDMSPYAIQ